MANSFTCNNWGMLCLFYKPPFSPIIFTVNLSFLFLPLFSRLRYFFFAFDCFVFVIVLSISKVQSEKISKHWKHLRKIGQIFLSTFAFIEQIHILVIAFQDKCGFQSNFIFLNHHPNRSPHCQHIDWCILQLGWNIVPNQCQTAINQTIWFDTVIIFKMICQQSNAVYANPVHQANKMPMKATSAIVKTCTITICTNQSCSTCQTFHRIRQTQWFGRTINHTKIIVQTVLSFAFLLDRNELLSIFYFS